jgi:uncharacterized protein YjbJ (UPF0337 family)
VIDTLRFANRLKQAGFTDQQSEAFAEAWAEQARDDLPARSDIIALDGKIDRIHADLAARLDRSHTELDGKTDRIHADLAGRLDRSHTELVSKIDHLRAELEGKIDRVKTELEGKIDRVKTELEGKMDHVRTELEGKIDHVKTELEGKIDKLTWMVGFTLAGIVAVMVRLLFIAG